jgi:hypothetical protein
VAAQCATSASCDAFAAMAANLHPTTSETHTHRQRHRGTDLAAVCWSGPQLTDSARAKSCDDAARTAWHVARQQRRDARATTTPFRCRHGGRAAAAAAPDRV